MDRRGFLKCSSAVAIAAGGGLFIAPNPANAATLATVSAAFSLASGISGFLSRGSNPTVPLLISLSEAVKALGIGINAIDRKLDVMLSELLDIKERLRNLPCETQLLGRGIDIREPYTAFLELEPEEQVENPSKAYLQAIPEIRNRMRTMRIRYLELAQEGCSPAFEAVLQLALAQDAELILASEMQRPEMHALGLAEDIRGTRDALAAYASFFEAAIDPGTPGSLTAVKAALAQKVNERLGENVQLAPRVLTSVDGRQGHYSPERSEKVCNIFEGGSAKVMCGDDGSPTCLGYVPPVRDRSPGVCHEPGFRLYFDTTLNIKRIPIPQTVTEIDDALDYPYLHKVSGDLKCGPSGRPSDLRAERALERLNLAANDANANVVDYYKVHYAHGICALAQSINARHQRVLRDLLDI